MRPTLQPTDVLERRPSAQFVPLPGGRLLVRCPDDVRVLDGVTREDAEAVLAQVDGRRTAAEICDRLEGTCEPRRVVRLLRGLLGSAVRRIAPAVPGRVLVVNHGRVGRRLTKRLAQEGIGDTDLLRDSRALTARLGEADLVVVAREGTLYRTLFALQTACLDAAVPSLWVTVDGDGVRVGPSVVPGVTACFACAQLANFAFLERSADAAFFEALAKARTQLWTEAVARPEALLRAAEEARQLLAEDGEPRLLARVEVFSARGRTGYAVTPSASCPLCSAAAPDTGGRLAGRAAAEVVEVHERRGLPARRSGGDLATSVGILGGGTAGYLTALSLNSKLPRLRVTLIESSAVPIVGVGEATTPLMPQFLHADLGIGVHELFREVRPTLKLGIRFLWGTPPDADFNYPFGPVRALEAVAHDGHLRNCSLRSMMMSHERLPILSHDGRGAASRLGTEVAYHLDNATFVAFLRRKAREAGIEHVDAIVADVEVSEDGEEVTALVTDDGRRLAFDLYVDCSGFRSLLLGKALGSPFKSFAGSLFTDRAWVATAPHGGTVRPYTLAETMRCGWCWSTPQAGEDHRGYVFSSAFARDEEALAEMRAANPGMGEPRLVRFRAGRHEHFWKGNVVALGNAYGFVEPLESTALHMLIRQIGWLLSAFPLRRGERGLEGLLNRKTAAAWDYLRWFLALHYKFNRKLDTPFWRACREDVDVSGHGELIAAFSERGPLAYDGAARAHFDYPDPLWGPAGVDVILLGQGVASALPRPRVDRNAWQRRLALCRRVLESSLPQARALELLADEPRLRDQLAAAFRAVGSAFPARRAESS